MVATYTSSNAAVMYSISTMMSKGDISKTAVALISSGRYGGSPESMLIMGRARKLSAASREVTNTVAVIRCARHAAECTPMEKYLNDFCTFITSRYYFVIVYICIQ